MKRRLSSGFLNDLYRDLRDRRLLIPIAALAVAVVAVPMVIGGGSASAPPPPAAAQVDAEAGAQVATAVLTSDPGVREYRKRLAKLKASNPFAQKFALPDPEKTALESVGGTSDSAESSSVSSVTTSASGGSAGADSTVTDSVTDTTVTDDGADVSTSTSTDTVTTDDSNGGNNHHKPPKTMTRFYSGRIDVTVGPLGDAKRIDDVRVLDFLPSEKNPVVAFLGLSHGADAAVFSVSRDAVKTEGDGSCSPKQPAPCQYLTLKTGGQQTFTFADGTTYRLRLLHTNVVAVPDPRAQQGAEQADSPGD
jgi:hypothetical protein